MPAIKLISVNVERSKHLDRVLPFIQREQPDVLCVMELCERDIARFESVAGECRAFSAMMMHPGDAPETEPILIGNGIFSAHPGATRIEYYRGNESHARSLPALDVMEDISLIRFDMQKGGETFRIVTTHFTWTPDGTSSQQQRVDLQALFQYLDTCEEVILCGDFNAPRGGEIFSLLAEKYADNIPSEYESSIDIHLHRAGHLASEQMDKKMVDGLFTTPAYGVSNVKLVSGVSDHMAIVADITRG